MKCLRGLKNKWLRGIGYTLSLTTIAFVFQACYGGPQDRNMDEYLSGSVTDTEGKPLVGINVVLGDSIQYTTTDENGVFNMFVPRQQSYNIRFKDENDTKTYLDRDTTIENRNDLYSVNMELQKIK